MKHERAAVVFLSYLIGFTTSFIAYGLVTDQEYLAPLVVAPSIPSTQMASLVEATPKTVEVPVEIDSNARIEQAGLFLVRNGEERLVSASYESAPNLGTLAHTKVSTYAVSTDGSKLFYCATSIDTVSGCNAYIYNWDDNTIQLVSVADQALLLEATAINAAWSSDNRLQVNQHVSVDAAAPWVMQ